MGFFMTKNLDKESFVEALVGAGVEKKCAVFLHGPFEQELAARPPTVARAVDAGCVPHARTPLCARCVC